jgi:hypothetical protein
MTFITYIAVLITSSLQIVAVEFTDRDLCVQMVEHLNYGRLEGNCYKRYTYIKLPPDRPKFIKDKET